MIFKPSKIKSIFLDLIEQYRMYFSDKKLCIGILKSENHIWFIIGDLKEGNDKIESIAFAIIVNRKLINEDKLIKEIINEVNKIRNLKIEIGE